MMQPTIKSLDQARALKVGREVLKSCVHPDGVIWKKRIRYEWQTSLKRPFVVELLNNGDLRVIDGKTREVIAHGPAWAVNDRFGHNL